MAESEDVRLLSDLYGYLISEPAIFNEAERQRIYAEFDRYQVNPKQFSFSEQERKTFRVMRSAVFDIKGW